jgi:protein-disulfide isomerase
LCLAAILPAHADPLTPQQKEAVQQIIHDYLLNNPDVLIDALKAAQQHSEEQAAALTRQAIVEERDALLADPDSPVGGNPKGDVTIVEFFDYRCPYCKEVEPSLEALLKEDPKLRIVYKEFPILGPASVIASHVALAAEEQGKYAAFHRAMMATKGKVDEAVILRVAASVGLDVDKVKADMSGEKIDDIIQRNYELAKVLDIRGTPAFIVGDTLAPGAADIATLRKLVADARAHR